MLGRVLLVVFLMMCEGLTLHAQQMTIENYARIKRPFWKRKSVAVDKQMALLDLYTTENGFTFTANGKEAVEPEEGNGVITVKLPHKTQFVTIKHDTYGQYTWRVPVKYLKKKKHYRANLIATDPTKVYKLKQQWVVMNISPKNAIVQIDSIRQMVRNGMLSVSLPVGKHIYEVETPFYQTVKDSFLLNDTAKKIMNVSLQPIYSYASVKTPWDYGDIYVDGQKIGRKEGTSGRLMAGTHRLSVFMAGTRCYDETFEIGEGEKKVVELTKKDFSLRHMRLAGQSAAKPLELPKTMVTLKADTTDTEIWVDRELMGKGEWSGELTQGYHQVTTKIGDVESEPYSLWLNDDFPQTVNLGVPQTSMGLVNVHGNVVGADIYVDGVLKGVTPTVLTGLSPKQRYVITISKPGYKTVEKKIQPRGNELTDLSVVMKKK